MGDGGGGGGEKPDSEFTGEDAKQTHLHSAPASLIKETKGSTEAVPDKTPQDVVGSCPVVHIKCTQVVLSESADLISGFCRWRYIFRAT